MIINSTELQNNFGKYLMLATKEDILITRNGTVIAKLAPVSHLKELEPTKIHERAIDYCYSGNKASFEDFMELRNNSEARYEYIDGEIFLLASPKTSHQTILAELFVAFYSFFKGRTCKPLMAPYDIEMQRPESDKKSIVQPDLMVICDLEEKLGEDDFYKGVPDLVVEILSESSKRKDMVLKLDLYMSSGVKEYWIVNPFNQEVTVYHFQEQNIHQNITFKQTETIQSYIFEQLQIPHKDIFI